MPWRRSRTPASCGCRTSRSWPSSAWPSPQPIDRAPFIVGGSCPIEIVGTKGRIRPSSRAMRGDDFKSTARRHVGARGGIMTDQLKETLTNAGRVLVSEDQGDYVAGHITARLPHDAEHFLMKPAGIGLDEMSPENIITVDLEGRKTGGTMPRHNEVFIHSEVLRARPDVHSVIHTHATHAVAFSSLGRPLLPVGNDGSVFGAGG